VTTRSPRAPTSKAEMSSEDAKAACEKMIDANSDACKVKKYEGTGGADLVKVKPTAKKSVYSIIPHSKGDSKIMALAWNPVGGEDNRMAIVDQLGVMFVWDTVKQARIYGCKAPFTQALALHPTDSLVLTGGMKNATTLWKRDGDSKLRETRTWIAHDGYISSVAFLDGGKKYLSASGDADIRIFDVNSSSTETSIQRLTGHTKDAQSAKFPRDDKSMNTFITCSSDKTCKMWDIRANMCTHTFHTESELNACSVFPDASLVACGGEKDKTWVFDVRAYKQVGKYARNNQKTASCEFSASGRELYVGHDDGALIVWDIFGSGENKQYAEKIAAHTSFDNNKKEIVAKSRVQVLDVGPDGFLASGGFDGTVKIWGAPKLEG